MEGQGFDVTLLERGVVRKQVFGKVAMMADMF